MNTATIDDPVTTNSQESRPKERPETEEVGAAWKAMSAEFSLGFKALRRSFYVERQALRLALFDSAFHIASVAAGALVGIGLAITGAVLLVLGIRRGFEQLSGGAWWGDVLLAVVLFTVVGTSAYAYRRWMHRSTLLRTQRKLAGLDPDSGKAVVAS